jgi:hypothetical protein
MGWQNQNQSLVIITATSGFSGLFIYSGPPALGNLIGSWASAAGTDPLGNAYPAGLSANQGVLTGMLLNSPSIVGATIMSSLLNAPSITQAAISGGTATQQTITFSSAGGVMLVYTTTTTTTTFSTAGAFQFTAPAGNYTAGKVEVWGGGASGSGGSATAGGEGGGGGEYAQEPAYPLVPGNVYNGVVGAGGTAASTGNAGNKGSQSSFDATNIVANPGLAGSNNGTGGAGGSGSSNTIHENGGAGGNASSTGGGGGGGSAGSTGAGGGGSNSSTSSGAAGGAAGTGGGAAGGGGGNSTVGGSGGTAPGGGGGGAGDAPTGGSGQQTFSPTETQSYFGNGTLRNTDGDLYQGYAQGNPGGDGDQFAYWFYDSVALAAFASGKTITGAFFQPLNLHTWYNSGMYAAFGYQSNTAGVHKGQQVNFIAEGAEPSIGLGAAFGGPLLDGSGGNAITLGPASSVGQSGNLSYYGYFSTDSGALTFTYTTGTGSVTSGAGAAGQVKITTTSTSVLECAISPASGSDAAGNAYAGGYTGPVTAFQPGSSPTALETWHNLSLASNWAGFSGAHTPRYQFEAVNGGRVRLSGIVQATANQGAGATITTLPAGYRPTALLSFATVGPAAAFGGISISSAGVITTNVAIGNGNNTGLDGITFELD